MSDENPMASEDEAGLAGRWAAFVNERFPLPDCLLMGTAFFLGNALAAHVLAGTSVSWPRLAAPFVATLLVFFRLRLFDEIKKHRTDRDTPGLIPISEAKRVAAIVALAEAALAAVCGPPALCAWGVVLLFSVLTCRDFFVGGWLRPRMELCAVTYMLVAGWLALFIAVAATGCPVRRLPPGLWWFVPVNWAVFNVFEFAGQTLGTDEERPGIDSYSKRLRPWGAALLSLSMVVPSAWAAFRVIGRTGIPRMAAPVMIGMLLLTGIAAVLYVCRPYRPAARLFRGVMQLFVVGYYLVLTVCILS